MPFSNYHNILLIGIDDDEDDLATVENVVDELKITNKRFTTKVSEFLEGASKAAVNMCLIDNRLGKNTGLDVIRELKKLSPHNYIIVFSDMDGSAGKADFDVLMEYANSGMHKFLKKSDKDFDDKLKAYLTEGFEEAQKRVVSLEKDKAFARMMLESSKETDTLIEKIK